MIHAIPFKVVHPCPRPRAVPPCVTTTSTGLRPSPSTHLPLSPSPPLSLPLSLSRSLFRSFPLLVVFLSSHLLAHALSRSLAHSHTHACTQLVCARTHVAHTHRHIRTARTQHTHAHAHTLALVLSPYWLSIPACNDSMALPHPCAIQ